MNRSICLLLLMGAVFLLPTAVGVSQADAFCGYGWGWWGWNCTACYYPGCSYAPCYTPCYTTCCDPCYPRQSACYASCYPYGVSVGVCDAAGEVVEDEGYNAGGAEEREPPPAEPRPAPESPAVEPPSVEPPALEPAPAEDEEPDMPEPSPLEPSDDLLRPGDGGFDFSPLRPGDDIEPTEPATPGLEPGEGTIPSFRPSGAGGALEPPLSWTPSRADSGLLTIYVPYDAQVKINGLPTRSQGSRREYVSYGLEPGYSYEYQIEATVVRDGEVLRDTRTVTLTAGDKEAVAFGFNEIPAANVASAW